MGMDKYKVDPEEVLAKTTEGVGKCTFEQVNRISTKLQYLLDNCGTDEFSHRVVNSVLTSKNYQLLDEATDLILDVGEADWRDNIDYMG